MEFDKLLQDLEVDVPTLMARFCNNELLLQRFICKFPSEKTFWELSDAHEARCLPEEERAVHTLKGIAANLGFDRLFECCIILLYDLREQQTAVDEEFANICAEYKRLTDCINCFVAEI